MNNRDEHAGHHLRLKKRASFFSVSVAIILATAKLAVGITINSLAIIAMAIDSIMDIVMSAANFVGIRMAAQPADPEHPFGHGKFETMAALFQGTVILGIGIFLTYEGVRRIVSGDTMATEGLQLGIAIMAVSAMVSLVLSRYLRRTARTTDSLALQTDSLHYSTDVWTNGGVMVALTVMFFVPWPWLDPLISILIALYIIKEALPLLGKVLNELAESALPETQRQQITEIVLANREIVDLHDLRTRKSGSTKIMDMHITVCKNYTIKQAHDIADAVEASLKEQFADADIVIHLDPCSVKHCPEETPNTQCPIGKQTIKS
ncbi:cation diffusion facilitator family transporter [Desulfurispirillum indicum S5]|uniref:Cation diffusion facilitator family transporter n=1 Tax=Desulfurispirillum indicum (strain ATCC BAA-1389 / DSM 22839 / S5) TaxID=653733 RepID=E6W4W1_DESIS|nr:cation diffusion facilitator family transporter [Desulfurispirillum indicum]ADU64839.1 cation diffusion facilitator family transporter [Desulfurispirillum indicum S5]